MRTLKKRSVGPEVRALQHALNARPYLHLTEDGIFGTQTENAVREFQRRVRLTDDGIYGPQTDALLWARVVQADVLHVVPLADASHSVAPARPVLAPRVAHNNTPRLPVAAGQTPPPSSGAGIMQQVGVGGQVALAPGLCARYCHRERPPALFGPEWFPTRSYTEPRTRGRMWK